jgi:serine/threonine-protein kinase
VLTDTARLLDNFEQRFAELKGRKPNATVLSDLYTLGSQLEQRGRAPQATAVYRHLARFDNTYRDVAARLRRLMDAERAKPKAAPSAPNTATLNRAPAASTAGASAAGSANVAAPASADMQRLGRYQLEREIGRGAMGIVYLGRDTAINRMVAIKAIPLASEFSDAELVEARSRFFREAETAGRLNHPNIVTIYDVGEERGLAYIAMEYLKGRHLSDYAKSDSLMEPRKVLEVIGRTGIVLGTPSFMSPEQLEGRTVTGHSDLFSLGVSLFQLLTGQLPFTADSMTGLMQQIAEAPHPPLRAFRPDLPVCVESVIDRALAKNPDARYDSGAHMAAALEDCRSRIPSGLP